MADLSPTTGEEYYSGDFDDMKCVLQSLDLGGGKLQALGKEEVNKFQELVDREIDSILHPVYRVPLVAINQIQPDGTEKRIFPGSVQRAARYWSAGLILQAQYQGVESAQTEQISSYIEESREAIYAIIRFNHRLQGQGLRSNISRTMPPTMQPPFYPERR